MNVADEMQLLINPVLDQDVMTIMWLSRAEPPIMRSWVILLIFSLRPPCKQNDYGVGPPLPPSCTPSFRKFPFLTLCS